MGAIAQSSPVTRKLFHFAYESKRAALKQGDLSGGRFGPLWDRLVFSKVRARLGGRFAEGLRNSICMIIVPALHETLSECTGRMFRSPGPGHGLIKPVTCLTCRQGAPDDDRGVTHQRRGVRLPPHLLRRHRHRGALVAAPGSGGGSACCVPEAGPPLMRLAGGAQQRSNHTYHRPEHPKLQN